MMNVSSDNGTKSWQPQYSLPEAIRGSRSMPQDPEAYPKFPKHVLRELRCFGNFVATMLRELCFGNFVACFGNFVAVLVALGKSLK